MMHLLRIIISILMSIAINTKFVFPDVLKETPINCTLFDGSKGKCRNIKNCPHITVKLSTSSPEDELKHCYFIKSDEYVCCRDKFEYSTNLLFLAACSAHYPLVLKYTGFPSSRDWSAGFGVAGLPTIYGEFSYMVALGWETNIPQKYKYDCGGVLISRNFVLTAAHCIYVNSEEPVVVLPGGVNLTDTEKPVYKIATIIVHSEYDDKQIYNDIALIKLENPLSLLDGLKPVCLWPYEQKSDEVIDVTGIGYGHTSFAGQPSNQLLKVYLTTTSNANCQSFYHFDDHIPNGIINSQICAKDPKNVMDTCQGDSGGPIIKHEVAPFAIGITSFGQGCENSPPGVYTRISAFKDWIADIVWPNKQL